MQGGGDAGGPATPVVPGQDRPLDAERIQQSRQIVGKVIDSERLIDDLRAAVAAGVVAQAPEASGKAPHLRVPHRERRAERVRERDHRGVCGPFQLVEQLDAVGADMGHGAVH